MDKKFWKCYICGEVGTTPDPLVIELFNFTPGRMSELSPVHERCGRLFGVEKNKKEDS